MNEVIDSANNVKKNIGQVQINGENWLIIKSAKDTFEKYYNKHMKLERVKTVPLYKYNKGIMWKITVIWLQKLHLPFQHLWYGKWKKDLNKYDAVIVFDRNLNWNIISYIKKKGKKGVRVIAWYWNMIKKGGMIPEKYRRLCEVWSFDEQDCQTYNLNFNRQFYFSKAKTDNVRIKYDAIFVGFDKGRYNIVNEISEVLKKNGFNVFINIVKDHTSVGKYKDYKKRLEYEQILQLMTTCRCVIDVPQSEQNGITVRVLEAIFYKKKLITTDVSIKSMDFYHPENILVWNAKLSEQEIKVFFHKPYKEIDEKILYNYSFEGWMKGFDGGTRAHE